MPAWSWWKRKQEPHKLQQPIQRHLGVNLTEAHSVAHEIKHVQRVNIQRVLDQWAGEPNTYVRAYGYSSTGYFTDHSLAKYLITDELIQAPIERVRLDSGPDETLDCVVRGLFLFSRGDIPVVVAFRQGRLTSELPILEVIAPSRETARNTLSAILEQAHRISVHKGRTLSLETSGSWRQEVVIRFHRLRQTARDDIVLPDELVQVVERNVFGMLRHAQTLRTAGRGLRRGLLFHGPPGTGKTMLVRYLTQACEDHTVILMTGSQQGLVREACQLARTLAPSIVVLEDVDLVAEERDHNRCPFVLHELMNEMDGLGPRDEVTFLLTTNRPDILEPALSARPGRIDQAIAFPLPDEACRRRLFEVYGRGLDLAAVDIDRWVNQTDGVSHAFVEELLRKATLMAAERGEVAPPLPLTDADIHHAIHELIYFGGELTQKLLGYRTGRIGYQSLPEK